MPRLDGRDLYLSLVRNGNSVQHRMIFITGDTLTPHTLEFLEGNSLPYLAKPFLVEELKKAVEQGLDQGMPHLGPSLLPPGGAGPYLTTPPRRGGKG
jgi:DNA-binding response OmpR family regulator